MQDRSILGFLIARPRQIDYNGEKRQTEEEHRFARIYHVGIDDHFGGNYYVSPCAPRRRISFGGKCGYGDHRQRRGFDSCRTGTLVQLGALRLYGAGRGVHCVRGLREV